MKVGDLITLAENHNKDTYGIGIIVFIENNWITVHFFNKPAHPLGFYTEELLFIANSKLTRLLFS